MAGALDTFTKFINLRNSTNLSNTRFAELCGLYGIVGMSDASLNRAIQRKRFNNEVEGALRPLVLRIETLVEKMLPVKMDFEELVVVKLLLDILDSGGDVSVRMQVNSGDAVTTSPSDNVTDGGDKSNLNSAVKDERNSGRAL